MLKNVPKDTSLVLCSTNPGLNRDQSLSVSDSLKDNKLTYNSLEVNQPSTNNEDLPSKVFVLSIEGNPLMPTKCSRARKMLISGKARVVKRLPFTIQLNYVCGNIVQEISLGIDTGYGNIGFAATTEKDELICGTLILDGKTKERLKEKSMYRGNRRDKLWYRESRWANRKREPGWLPPSIERRYQTHLTLIKRLQKLLLISSITLEVAKFDIAKIENPLIESLDYQQGTLYDYQNMKSYLMSREKGKCQFCGQDFKGQPSQIHHIKPKREGGNDRPDNLALLHEKCHNEMHAKHLEYLLKSNSEDYKQTTFMNIINKRFKQDIPELNITYGNITFVNRNNLGLAKTHYNDAFVISNGTNNQSRTKAIEIKQVHRNNRVLQLNRKGFKPSIKKEKSKANPGDLFWVTGKQYTCTGMFNKGKYICYGSTSKKEYFNFTKVEKIYKQGSFVWKY